MGNAQPFRQHNMPPPPPPMAPKQSHQVRQSPEVMKNGKPYVPNGRPTLSNSETIFLLHNKNVDYSTLSKNALGKISSIAKPTAVAIPAKFFGRPMPPRSPSAQSNRTLGSDEDSDMTQDDSPRSVRTQDDSPRDTAHQKIKCGDGKTCTQID